MGNSGGPEGPRTASLREQLDRLPRALVAAIGADGMFVEPPASLDLGDCHVVRARAATEIVRPEDRPSVIAAWEHVLDDGVSSTPIDLPGAPEPATMHFFDVRPEHGVLVMVLDAGGDPPPVEPVEPPSTVGMAKVVRVRKDATAVLRDVDGAVTDVLGFSPEELVGRRSLDLIHPDDHELAITAWMDMLASRGLTTRARLRHVRADGGWTWLDISNENLLDHDDDPHVRCEMVDVSEEVAAVDALHASEQLLRRLTGSLPVGVFHLDLDRRVQLVNPRLHEILRTDPGAEPATMLRCIVDRIAFDRALEAVLDGSDVDVELDVIPVGADEVRRCTLSLRTLASDGHITGAVGCLDDVTESVQLRQELERRATVDELTGCLNRSSVLAALDEALRADTDVAVVFIDLDDFKGVNDGYGHAAGDEVLQAVGARLRAAVRAHDSVGRMGGDEFLAVCTGLGGEHGADELRRRIADALADPVAYGGRRLAVPASLGVRWVPAGSDVDADALVASADQAMYDSKGERRTG